MSEPVAEAVEATADDVVIESRDVIAPGESGPVDAEEIEAIEVLRQACLVGPSDEKYGLSLEGYSSR